jgi:DNA polymerase I-like protein with 3'-5' exonuclease and polymerase domains
MVINVNDLNGWGKFYRSLRQDSGIEVRQWVKLPMYQRQQIVQKYVEQYRAIYSYIDDTLTFGSEKDYNWFLLKWKY